MNGERNSGSPGVSLPPDRAQSHSLLQTPAVQAVLIQIASLAIVLALSYGAVQLGGWQPELVEIALLQGVCAAAMTWVRKLASWWLVIQGMFPLAVVATLALQLSPSIFLILFVVLLGWYWSTFRTQVPFYPSGPATWKAVLAELPADRPVRLTDIGSGLGGLVLHLAEARPESRFTGIELAPLPWLASVLRQRFRRSAARFIRGDYGQLNLADEDVVFAYLSPAAMPSLWQKARAEMRPGTLLLSFEFAIPGVEPHFTRMTNPDGPALYGWRMPGTKT
jgi:hypothetical protein